MEAVGTRAEAPARMNEPTDSDALALARHAAATWIQERRWEDPIEKQPISGSLRAAGHEAWAGQGVGEVQL